MTTNLEAAVACFEAHRTARQWDNETVAGDLLEQLGVDPGGKAKNAAPTHAANDTSGPGVGAGPGTTSSTVIGSGQTQKVGHAVGIHGAASLVEASAAAAKADEATAQAAERARAADPQAEIDAKVKAAAEEKAKAANETKAAEDLKKKQAEDAAEAEEAEMKARKAEADASKKQAEAKSGKGGK